ncbi:MAG TPA: hypothetical protein GXZ66_10625 [Clostridiaceae bacterium]|jgi:ASC-1-like (ASCH) protein|nr:hypothetical protein [Clostridiaceae bacterium]
MSFNNGYYFFEHSDKSVSGYIMFRKSNGSVRVQVLVEGLNVPADKGQVYLSNAQGDKLHLADVPLRKMKNGRRSVNCDVRFNENRKSLNSFDCAHIVVRNKSVIEAFSGKVRNFDRDMFNDNYQKKPEKTAAPEKKELDKIEEKPKPELKPMPEPKPLVDIETKPEIKEEKPPEPQKTANDTTNGRTIAPSKTEQFTKPQNMEKPSFDWDEFLNKELKAADINKEVKKEEKYPDDTFNEMLLPFDPFNTTNKAYNWWVADNYQQASDAFKAINVLMPTIITKFLYNNIENHKHALIGRYEQDGRKFVILGIPSANVITNSVARWMKCSVFYTDTEYVGYLLYYIDAKTSSLVKAVPQED